MEVETTKCLQLSTLSKSTKWHIILGHVGLDTMKMMINKELVVGIPKITNDKETCSTCLLVYLENKLGRVFLRHGNT